MLNNPERKNTSVELRNSCTACHAAYDFPPDKLDDTHPETVSGESFAVAGSPPRKRAGHLALATIAAIILATIGTELAFHSHAEQAQEADVKASVSAVESVEWY